MHHLYRSLNTIRRTLRSNIFTLCFRFIPIGRITLNLSSSLSNHSVYSIETGTVEGRIELDRSLLTVISRVIDYFYTVIGYLCKNLVERWDISTMFRGISQNYPQRNYGGRGCTCTAERDRRLSNRKYEKHMVPR